LRAKLTNSMTADFSLDRRMEGLLDTRTGERVRSIPTFQHWRSTFDRCPGFISPETWQKEFANSADLDWIVDQAFRLNPGLRIDLIFQDALKNSLKRVESFCNGEYSILWSC